jgi:hypothetical protein
VKAPVNGLAIASLVVGILAVCASWVLPYDYLIFGIPAMFLGMGGIQQAQHLPRRSRTMATVGVLLGAVGGIISLIVFGAA